MKKDRKEDWFKWKADCLISSFQRRHKKANKEYKYITKRRDYAEILKEKFSSCCYCGVKHTKSNFSVDHKLPLSRGGDTVDTNLTYCCTRCNSSKGTMSDEEFRQLLLLINNWEDKGQGLLSRLIAASNVFRKNTWRRSKGAKK